MTYRDTIDLEIRRLMEIQNFPECLFETEDFIPKSTEIEHQEEREDLEDFFDISSDPKFIYQDGLKEIW